MTDKAQTFSTFAHAFVDCLLLFSKRLRSSARSVVCSLIGGNPEVDRTDPGYSSGTALPDFVRKQTARLAREIFRGRFQPDPLATIKPLSDVVTKLDEVDKGMT